MTQFVRNAYRTSKLFIIVILMIFSVNTKAYSPDDFANDLARCITSPCSCGQPSVEEKWGPDGKNMRQLLPDISTTYPDLPLPPETTKYIEYANQACMPFNRYAGRTGCLKQFQPPITPLLPSYRVYCAEADPNSSSTNPSIIVRMQACNIFSCFTKSASLNAGGAQCVTWPTQYGIPTIRFCARVSSNKISQKQNQTTKAYMNYTSIRQENPENYIYVPPGSRLDGLPVIEYTEDDGYMYHFLDTNGYPRPDPGITNPIGYQVYLPKICLYEDPSYVEALTSFGGNLESYRQVGIDTYDRNIYSQFLPKGSDGGHPNPGFLAFMGNSVNQNMIVERKFFFTNNNSNFISSPTQIPDVNGTSSDTSWNTQASPEDDYTPWSNYANWVNNFVVKKYNSLGCTHLPIGPYPPPFCPTLNAPPQSITMQPICATSTVLNPPTCPAGYVTNPASNATPATACMSSANNSVTTAALPAFYRADYTESTLASPCVKSDVNNNFISNAVRVSLDSITPICLPLNATGSLGTGFCATINNQLSLKAIHDMGDTLPVCSAAYNTSCVKPPPSCNTVPPAPAPLNCAATSITPDDGVFRIVYGMKQSANGPIIPLKGYPSDIGTNVCNQNTILYPCATIYGVNSGAYTDLVFNLSSITSADYQDKYIKNPSITLMDNNGHTFTINPYISFQGAGQPNLSVPRDPALQDELILPPNSMCVTYVNDANPNKGKKAGCTARAKPPKLRSYCCNSPSSPVTVRNNDLTTSSINCTPPPSSAPAEVRSCTSQNDSPQMVVGLDFNGVRAGTSPVPITSTAYKKINPRDLSGKTSPASTTPVVESGTQNYTNIAGYLLDTLVVDSNYYTTPFSGRQNIPAGSTLSIFGSYQGCNYPSATNPGNLSTCNFPVKMDGSISSVGQSGFSSMPPVNPLPPYYLGGIEYTNGKYQRGGSFFYAGAVSEPKCHSPIVQSDGSIYYDDSSCVLAKLNYADSINCNSFKSLFKAYNACPNNASSCTDARTPTTLRFNSAYGGGTAVSLKSCVVNGANQDCYMPHSSLTLPICQASNLPQDRALPKPLIVDANNKFNPPAAPTPAAPPLQYQGLTAAQVANIALDETDYYNTTVAPAGTFCALASGSPSPGGGLLFDVDKCAIRDKTMFESGVSSPVPYMFCPAVTPASSDTGYATWSLTPLGGQSIGSCLVGYQPLNGTLATRTCKADMKNNTFLDKLPALDLDDPAYKSLACGLVLCPGVSVQDASSASGFASWESATYTDVSTAISKGTCKAGYAPPAALVNGVIPTMELTTRRACKTTDGGTTYGLEAITAATTCLGVCPAEAPTSANGFTNWPAQTSGYNSTGRCQSGYTAPTAGLGTRRCQPSGSSFALAPRIAGQSCYKPTVTIANDNGSSALTISSTNANVSTSGFRGYAVISHNYNYDCECNCVDFGLLGRACSRCNRTCTTWDNYGVYTITIAPIKSGTYTVNFSNYSSNGGGGQASNIQNIVPNGNTNIAINGQNCANVGCRGDCTAGNDCTNRMVNLRGQSSTCQNGGGCNNLPINGSTSITFTSDGTPLTFDILLYYSWPQCGC